MKTPWSSLHQSDAGSLVRVGVRVRLRLRLRLRVRVRVRIRVKLSTLTLTLTTRKTDAPATPPTVPHAATSTGPPRPA